MGVKRLLSFVNGQGNLFYDDCRLRNTKVIFDGPNMSYCFVEFDDRILSSNDYDVYYQAIREKFENFLECKITPVVVMGGAWDKKKCLKEESTQQHNNYYPCKTLLFLQVLRDLEIEHYRAEYDKNLEIGRKAMELKCPVISNDSDFFIYDVDFIPFAHLNFENCMNNKYIPCLKFNKQKFLRNYNMKLEILPIFATAIGNDFIQYEDLPFPLGYLKRYLTVIALFNGKSFNEAKLSLENLFEGHDDKNTIPEKINDSLNYYDLNIPLEKRKSLFENSGEYEKMLKLCQLPSYYAGILHRNDFDHPISTSIYWDSLEVLIAGMYTFIQRRNETKLKLNISETNSETVLKEISVLQDVDISSNLLSSEQRDNFFYRVLDLNENDRSVLSSFPSTWRLFMSSFLFWLKKFNNSIEVGYHAHAILLNIIGLHVLRRGTPFFIYSNSDTKDQKGNMYPTPELEQILMDINIEEWATLEKIFSNMDFYTSDYKEIKDKDGMSPVLLLLYILEFAVTLHKVVGTSMEDLRFEKFAKGSMITVLTMTLMEHKCNSFDAAMLLLDHSPAIQKFYKRMVSLLENYI